MAAAWAGLRKTLAAASALLALRRGPLQFWAARRVPHHPTRVHALRSFPPGLLPTSSYPQIPYHWLRALPCGADAAVQNDLPAIQVRGVLAALATRLPSPLPVPPSLLARPSLRP